MSRRSTPSKRINRRRTSIWTSSPPQAGPRPHDQINLTDEDSRIMKVAGDGFEQCYNAQALVDSVSMLVMVPQVTQAANDKEQVKPMVAKLQALADGLNQPGQSLADSGYFSEQNVETCNATGIEPLIAAGRDRHHAHWRARFDEPAPSPAPASAVAQMKHTLKTTRARATDALRKQTVEPVFGIIKSVMGFRQFLLRGLANVSNEWTLRAGEAAVQPIKAFGSPIMDVLGPIPYAQLNGMLDAAFPKGALNYWKSHFVDTLSDAAIDATVARFAACPSPMSQVLFEHFHDAATRVPVGETAYALRGAGFNTLILGKWMDPRQTDAFIAWVRESYAALQPFVGPRRYVNYLSDDDANDAALAAAYGPNLSRLRRIKAKVDPKNVFHHNINIRPE